MAQILRTRATGPVAGGGTPGQPTPGMVNILLQLTEEEKLRLLEATARAKTTLSEVLKPTLQAKLGNDGVLSLTYNTTGNPFDTDDPQLIASACLVHVQTTLDRLG